MPWAFGVALALPFGFAFAALPLAFFFAFAAEGGAAAGLRFGPAEPFDGGSCPNSVVF